MEYKSGIKAQDANGMKEDDVEYAGNQGTRDI